MPMKRLCTAAIFLVVQGWTNQSPAQEIERLLAAVNGRVITEGDLKMARTLNLLVRMNSPGASLSREQELNGMIDLELLRQEMENFQTGQAEQKGVQTDISTKMSELRSAYAEIGGLPTLLRQLGLKEDELLAYLRLEALIRRFMIMRFLPFAAAEDPPEVQEKKVSAAMDQWLENIRNHSRIEIFPSGTLPTEKKLP